MISFFLGVYLFRGVFPEEARRWGKARWNGAKSSAEKSRGPLETKIILPDKRAEEKDGEFAWK